MENIIEAGNTNTTLLKAFETVKKVVDLLLKTIFVPKISKI